MSDYVSNPLLDLLKEQGLIDDLQFEEVQEEITRSAKSVIQVLQDSGILDLDTILEKLAGYLGTEVVSLRSVEFTPELLKTIPGNTARMYQCIPIALNGDSLQVAFADPLNPERASELGFVIRKEVQSVVVDPVEVQKSIEKFYGADTESVSDVLKDLGADSELAEETNAAAATNNAAILVDIANEVPIVRLVNIV